jgi:hypothetical protein
MQKPHQVCRLSVLLAACWLLPGCSNPPPPPQPVEVKGHVSLPATIKPDTYLLLLFHPADKTARAGRPEALIGADGSFTVQCIPGKYQVTITAIGTGGGATGGPAAGNLPGTLQQLGIPAKYFSPATTPLEVTVPSEGLRDVSFVVE